MKKFIYILILIISFSGYSQTIIDTEANLKKIDSTFQIFGTFSGLSTKGNLEMQILNSNLTIGQKIDKNLFRFTFENSMTKFNGILFNNNISGQFRYNHFYKENNSFFSFLQLGKSLRSSLDSRNLFGFGVRNRFLSKESNYLDFAYGPFYEIEKYPSYSYDQINYNSFTKYNFRLSINAFSNLKITDEISLMTTIYSQWNLKDFEDIRVYLNSYLTYAVNKNISVFLRYTSRSSSIQYVKGNVNDTNLMYGLNISI
tara:strand:- start:5441 stop:6211 length:771 start_codon:yes stop_codon:yes gene_type:complete